MCTRPAISLATCALLLGPLPPASASYLSPELGGNGGRPYSLTCDADSVIVGISGKWGMYLDSLSVMCRRVKDDGTLGTTYQLGPVGGSGGDHAATASCPPNEVANSIWVMTGSFSGHVYVGEVTILCGAWNPATRRTASASEKDLRDGYVGTAPLFGNLSRLACPQDGTPARGFSGRASMLVDSIRMLCDAPTALPVPAAKPPPPAPSPAFTTLPAAPVVLPASTGGDVQVAISGPTPLSLTMQVPSAYATRFELVSPPAPVTATAKATATFSPTATLTRTVRFKGGVTLPTSLGRSTPVNITVTLAATDGRGSKNTRAFVIVAR